MGAINNALVAVLDVDVVVLRHHHLLSLCRATALFFISPTQITVLPPHSYVLSLLNHVPIHP